ncbi:MAG: hypothetical protein HOV81_37560 [Kofleriaceae bacterium]|nr:hypothetical protein [Kofleriaceae bacterium]
MTETSNNATPAETRPPDRPRIPRPHRSFLTGLTIALCVAILGGYTALAYSQRELGHEDRDEIPSGMRSTPGGYRTYSYWHSGYHGGK